MTEFETALRIDPVMAEAQRNLGYARSHINLVLLTSCRATVPDLLKNIEWLENRSK